MTINDLPVGRSVEETIRLVKAFQFTVRVPASQGRIVTHDSKLTSSPLLFNDMI